MAQLALSEIWIYPVKSLGGVRLEKAKIFGKGLQFDRRWMLIDNAGVFMTQRVHPRMALFKLELHSGHLSVTFKSGETTPPSTAFPLGVTNSMQSTKATIWDDKIDVLEVDPKISQWLSQYLEISCKLVYFPEEKTRPVHEKYAVNNEHVSLADAFPFLIIGQSSLDDLNGRLPHPVPMNRFRPNFVFTGGRPYEEDEWQHLSIGKNRFAAVKKSARCQVTTVNQDTGEKGTEPLRTLSGYRKIDNNIYFGQNLVALSEGEVAVGDRIVSLWSTDHRTQ